jgi:hypothetical protein
MILKSFVFWRAAGIIAPFVNSQHSSEFRTTLCANLKLIDVIGSFLHKADSNTAGISIVGDF